MYAPAAFLETTLLPVSLLPFLVCLWALLEPGGGTGWRTALLAGLLVGLIAGLRPPFVLLGAASLAAVPKRRGAVPFLAGLLLPLLALSLWHYAQAGRFSPFASSTGAQPGAGSRRRGVGLRAADRRTRSCRIVGRGHTPGGSEGGLRARVCHPGIGGPVLAADRCGLDARQPAPGARASRGQAGRCARVPSLRCLLRPAAGCCIGPVPAPSHCAPGTSCRHHGARRNLVHCFQEREAQADRAGSCIPPVIGCFRSFREVLDTCNSCHAGCSLGRALQPVAGSQGGGGGARQRSWLSSSSRSCCPACCGPCRTWPKAFTSTTARSRPSIWATALSR